MPVKRTGMVCGGLVADEEVDGDAVRHGGWIEPRLHHAADPDRAVERQAFAGDVAGRVEEGRLVAAAPTWRAAPRRSTAATASSEQDEALVLGLHGRSLSASASRLGAAHRGPAPEGQAERRRAAVSA